MVFEPTVSCVRPHEGKVTEKIPCVSGLSDSQLTEFGEFLFHLGKTPMCNSFIRYGEVQKKSTLLNSDQDENET